MTLLISDTQFLGANENINPKRLGPGIGVFSQNLDTRHGDFRGLRAADSVHTLPDGGGGSSGIGSSRFYAHGDAGPGNAEINDLTVIAARDAFLGCLTGYEVEDCEGLTPVFSLPTTTPVNPAGQNPTLTFGAITCTTTGVQAVSDPGNVRTFGRMNTTPSGSKYIESIYNTTTAPHMKFEFSAPIAAMGFYVTDVDDFGTAVRVWLTDSGGKRYIMALPEYFGGSNPNASVGFFGFIAGDLDIVKVEVVRDDNLTLGVAESTPVSLGFTTDQIGIDDIIVATQDQIGSPISYPLSPSSYPDTLGIDLLVGLHFNSLVSGEVNVFPNSGGFGVQPDAVEREHAVDSAANSTSAGTWVTDAAFHGKAYACIGQRLTVAFPSNLATLGGNSFLQRSGITIDFEFKRTGARVGTGEIVHIPNLVSIRCNASHAIQVELNTSAGPITTVVEGTTALTVGTKYHVRVQMHRVDNGLGGVSAHRYAIFLDGVPDYDSLWTALGDQVGLGVSEQLGYGTVNQMLVGGRTATDYTPGVIDEVQLYNAVVDQYSTVSVPAAPFMTVYPTGWGPSPDETSAGGPGIPSGGGGSGQQITIYRMGRDTPSDTEFWLQSDEDGDFARSLLASDPNERTYITGCGFDRPVFTDMTLIGSPPYPADTYWLGIPAPGAGMSLAIGSSGVGLMETRVYVSTYVRSNGDESAPSDAVSIDCPAGSTINITGLPAVPGGNDSNITHRRVYVSTGGDFLRIHTTDIAVATTTATDNGSIRGLVLQTGGSTRKPAWLEPPTDGKGIIELWAGMHGMWRGKQYMTCVPYNPHGWPAEYKRQIPDTIVGSAKWGQSWLLATTGIPRVVTGTSPSAMVDAPIASSQACVSKRSVVGVGHGVCWAGPKGLSYHGQRGTLMLTQGIVTPETWAAMDPSTIIGASWQGWYIGFFNDGTRRGFMISTVEPAGIIWLTQGAYGVFSDPIVDALFLIDSGNEIKKWDTGDRISATHKSRIFRNPRQTNGNAARLVGTTFPATFSYWADGVLKVNAKTVSSDNAFRLPGNHTAEEFQYQIVGTGPIEGVFVAEEMVDLP